MISFECKRRTFGFFSLMPGQTRLQLMNKWFLGSFVVECYFFNVVEYWKTTFNNKIIEKSFVHQLRWSWHQRDEPINPSLTFKRNHSLIKKRTEKKGCDLQKSFVLGLHLTPTQPPPPTLILPPWICVSKSRRINDVRRGKWIWICSYSSSLDLCFLMIWGNNLRVSGSATELKQ